MKAFIISFLAFLVLDFIWLGFVVKGFNLSQLSQIGRIENGEFQVMYAPVIAVYILMALSMVMFVLPQTSELSMLGTFLKGAVMGLIIYGVYDGTNLGILKDYPIKFAIVDVLWGSFVYGAVTVITKKLV